MASSHPQKLTREEHRRAKDLEEARKAGTAPAELDEEGREINPHIPQYISKAPWYLNSEKPTLSHQKTPAQHELKLEERIKEGGGEAWYKRGEFKGPAATKYRKGACTNCGAETHVARDCVDRPRSLGAKWTNKDIKPDEVITDVKFTWDGKRDRWAGYNADTEYDKVIQKYDAIEKARQNFKEKELEKKLLEKKDKKEDENASSTDSDDEDQDDEKYVEQMDMPGQKVDTNRRITSRNLRIREDPAKYIVNLDPDSGYYDPKSRSLRENPNPNMNPEELKYAGDNFYKLTGEAPGLSRLQSFAWDATERGTDISLQSDPSKTELMYKEFLKRQKKQKEETKESILAKYGGEEHLKTQPVELLIAQTENYVEYSRTGKVIKGVERAPVKSRFEEDVHPGNHTSVFGSWWSDGIWGFACCHQVSVRAYCTGQAGIEAAAASARMLDLSTHQNGDGQQDDEVDKRKLDDTSTSSNAARKKVKEEG